MYQLSLSQLSQELQSKKISSVELTHLFLERIEKFNPTLNAFISITKETALAQAKSADQAIAKGIAHPLTGIPIAHKDNLCTYNILTTCASKMLSNFIAPYDATLVHKLEQAGMVLLGKTNMDEFAMGSSNENSYYGPVKNPWDLDRVPGGSSGGSAAAIAARLAPAATGTDTGGSVRQPAALCGITGLKPTYGRISRYGIVAFASSLDQAGPMAASAEDVAFLLEAMSGFDKNDSTSFDVPIPHYTAHLRDSLKGLRIGLCKEFFHEDLDPTILNIILQAIEEYKKLGVEFKDISLPNHHLSIPAYYIIAPAECSSNLARYDGVRFGYRCENPQNLSDLYIRSRTEGFGSEVKRRIMIGTYLLSADHFDTYYTKALKARNLFNQAYQDIFQEVDCILSPTSPSIAFKLGEKVKNPVHMYLADIYTIGANLAGLPAISIPVGFHNQCPVGLQLMGNHWNEAKLLNLAHRYQEVTSWHTQIPKNFSI